MPGVKGKRGIKTKRIVNDNNTRLKIKTTQIMNRLTNHMLGKLELSATQIKAAEILLKKTLPDLSSVEMQQEVTERRVISGDAMSLDKWQKQYSEGDPEPEAPEQH